VLTSEQAVNQQRIALEDGDLPMLCLATITQLKFELSAQNSTLFFGFLSCVCSAEAWDARC
jgi:hypothetical protein